MVKLTWEAIRKNVGKTKENVERPGGKMVHGWKNGKRQGKMGLAVGYNLFINTVHLRVVSQYDCVCVGGGVFQEFF